MVVVVVVVFVTSCLGALGSLPVASQNLGPQRTAALSAAILTGVLINYSILCCPPQEVNYSGTLGYTNPQLDVQEPTVVAVRGEAE